MDGFWWVDGPGANRTVQREMILAWGEHFPQDELVVSVRGKHIDVADVPESFDIVATRMWPHAVSNAVELPRLARAVDADVVFAHNYTPMFGQSLVFVHDVMFMENPQWFSAAERAYFKPMPWMLRRATAVATSSRTESERLKRLVPYAPAAQPTGLAVGRHLADCLPVQPEPAPTGPYALVVGRLNIRKNLLNAIKAARYAGCISPEQPLIVVGDTAHSGKATEWDATAQELVDNRTVILHGRATDNELRWLYEHASATICVSLDEGFGLPPLEARSFGSPIVASDIPVFREVLGPDVAYVDPLDARDIARGVERAFRSRRKAPGHDASSCDRYSWASVVSQLRMMAAPSGLDF